MNQTTINAISGAISGIVVSATMSPLDVVKTRLQVSRLPRNEVSQRLPAIMKEMYREEGLRAFYKGMGTTMMGYAPSWAIYFVTYQHARSSFSKYIQNENLANVASSITAGAVNNVFTAPIWTIRTRMQTQIDHSRYKNSFDALSKVIRTEGVAALYRGLMPSMIGLVHVAIQFPLYEKFKKDLSRRKTAASSDNTLPHHDENNLEPHDILFASSTSKIVASVAAYPHEVLRSRLQDYSRNLQTSGARPYNNTLDAMSSILKQEGIRGFYRGLNTNLIRTVPAAVITLTTFEMSAKFLKKTRGVMEQSGEAHT